MPVSISQRDLRDALALEGERHLESAGAARVAFEAMGWDGDSDVLLRRYDVQLFAWYTLPRKFLVGVAEKLEILEGLARVLERVGGPAAGYGEICRREETAALIQASEDEDPDVWDRFRRLLDESGLEPPDTDLLTWGSLMGLTEASARDRVITALETAIEAGALTPGARTFDRDRGEVVKAALRARLDGEEGVSAIEAIRTERIEMWLSRPGSERHRILEPAADLLRLEAPLSRDPAAEATAPVRWLLELGTEGIALTQTGALSRALVREAAERWTGWWDARLHGLPHREADVVLLSELHQLMRELRLLRRRGRQLFSTRAGAALISDPHALALTLARGLLSGDDFRAACAELSVALLLAGVEADWSEPLARVIEPAVVESGWRSGGQPPDVRQISWTISDFIRPARAAGLIELPGGSLRQRDPLKLTEAGRPALIAALAGRATGPRMR